jgi:hypothetical protein
MRTAGGRPRHVRPHHKEHIGTAAQADCPEPAVPLMMIPKPLVLVGLTTMKLRDIAAYLRIGAGLTGIQLSQKIGAAFENWVLFMLGQKHWTTPLNSPERKAKNNGGLPASVIPDFVSALTLFSTDTGFTAFPLSEFWEIKAVTGALTPSTNQYQILGLLNVAQATQWGVAVWQETVAYDATDPNDPNPDLCIMEVGPMNQNVYPPGGLPLPFQINGACSKLSSPTTTPVVVPGNPDPPEVDG